MKEKMLKVIGFIGLSGVIGVAGVSDTSYLTIPQIILRCLPFMGLMLMYILCGGGEND